MARAFLVGGTRSVEIGYGMNSYLFVGLVSLGTGFL